MSAGLHDIVARRRTLVVQAAKQRGELIAQVAALRHSLRFAELGLRGLRSMRSHPLLAIVAAAAVAVVGPRRLLRAAIRGGLLLPVLLRLARTLGALGRGGISRG